MFAIVLVGGFGTRLRPLTEHVPKQMLPICGVPMIEWVVGHLADHGVEKVGLAMGYRPDAFLEAYPNEHIATTPYQVAVESEPLGTAGAIRFAVEQFQLTETFLVLNGDVLTDLDVRALVEFHRDVQAEATIALQPVDDPRVSEWLLPTTVAELKHSSKNLKKGLLLKQHQRWNLRSGTFCGRADPAGPVCFCRKRNVSELAAKGTLYALPSATYWLDTGTPAIHSSQPGHVEWQTKAAA